MYHICFLDYYEKAKTLDQKIAGGKILTKDIDSKRKFEIKAKIFGLKKAYFLGHPNSETCVQNA